MLTRFGSWCQTENFSRRELKRLPDKGEMVYGARKNFHSPLRGRSDCCRRFSLQIPANGCIVYRSQLESSLRRQFLLSMKQFSVGFWSAALALILRQLTSAAEPIVVFGLTNAPLGQAVLVGNVVTNVSPSGLDGVSILLGEADGGVFAYPDTADYPSDGDYLLGKAYGKLNGVPDQLLCSVRGRKVARSGGDGVYPVLLDFSPLGVTNFLAQVFTRSGRLVTQQEIGSGEPIMRTDYNGYKLARINPFWRTPDGGIAVVIEFPGSTGFQLPGMDDTGPFPFGTRLVLRALNPTGVVEFVSRVETTAGVGANGAPESDGISTFHMNEVRPLYFGRPHKALGDISLQAGGGKLKIARLDPAQPEPEDDFIEGTGVHVELSRASRCGVELQPVDLSGTNSEFGITALVKFSSIIWYLTLDGNTLGSARLQNSTNGLTLTGIFEPLGTNAQQVRLEVYKSGTLVGTSAVYELDQHLFPAISLSGHPRVVGAGAQANTVEGPPRLGLTFDSSVTFTMTNETENLSLEGDEVRLLSVGPIYAEFPLGIEEWVESVDSILINSRGLTDFTITTEREEPVPVPELSIVRNGNEVVLSWPDPNRAYNVLVSSNLESGANEGYLYPTYSGSMAMVTETIRANEVRFYWLLHIGLED
jgi:hypothetical protein